MTEAAVGIIEGIKGITECCICTEIFTEPRMLPCIHTFCLLCLEKTGSQSQKKPGDKMPCPLCRKEFIIPTEGLLGIQKNFFMERLIEMAKLSQPSDTIRYCDSCSTSESKTNAEAPLAKMYCIECEENLCDDCINYHKRQKQLKTHQIVVFGNQTMNERLIKKAASNNCDLHTKHSIEMYCHDCRQAICMKCFAIDHKGHSCSGVEDVAEKFRKQIEVDIEKVKTSYADGLNIRNKVELEKTNFMKQVETAETEIIKRADELKCLVDKNMQLLLAQLSSRTAETLKILHIQRDEIDMHLRILDSFKTYCSEIQDKGTPGEVCRAVDVLCSQSSELEQKHKSFTDQPMSSFSVTFEKMNLEGLLSERNIIGTFEGTEGADVIQKIPVIDRVVRGQHSIEGHELMVDYYSQDLGPPPEALSSNPAAEDFQGQGLTVEEKQPEVITVSAVVFDCTPKKVDFMTKNKMLKEQMEKELAAQRCSVVWPEDSNSGTIVFKCTASTAELAKEFSTDDWTETCTSLIKKYSNRVLIGKWDIPEEIALKFANQALGLKDGDGELMWEQSSCGGYVQYVGSEESVEKFTKQCQSLTKKLLEELQKENEIVTDVVDHVSNVQLQLLRMTKFDKQNEGPTLHISITDKEVNFQGTGQEILDVKTKLYEVINQETTQNYPATNFKLTALNDTKVMEYVKNSLREKDIRVVVASQKDKVVLSGLSRKDIDDAVRFLDSELIERKVILDDASAVVLTMPQWTEAISKLESSFPVLVVDVSPTQDSVMYLSTKDTLNKVVDEIENILKSNIQTEQFLPASEGKVKYMNKFLTTEINTTQNSLLSDRISITMELNGTESGVRVTGAANGVITALEIVKSLTESVLSYDYTNDAPGVQKAFRTNRGKDFIDALEHRSKVVIEIKESFVATSRLGAQLPTTKNVKAQELTVKLEATLPRGIVIKVIKGEITKCKVDALVIPCNDRLQPSEDFAKLIHDTGGSAIQDECKKHIAVHGTLLEGQVFASKAGKLPFKAILHTVSPKWKDGKSMETEYLKEAIDNTLKEALGKNFESIAMPAISTGSFGFPPASATSAIIEGIAEFFTDLKGQCCLKSIQLVDTSDQVVNYFHDALKTTIGVSSIRLVEDDTVAPITRNVGVTSSASPPAALVPHPPNAATFSVNVANRALTTSGGLTITLVLGAIAAQTVDVIVNTTTKEISFTAGAVSKSILDAAGPEINVACMKQCKGGRVKHDEVISTDPFKLPCKRVYHVACMGWDGDGGQCEKTTRGILSTIFKKASNDKMTSIAIPAIGTGGLGLPRRLVAKMMYEEAINFSKTNSSTNLRQIRFVVYDKDVETVAEFKKLLNNLSSSTNSQDTPTAPPRSRTLKKDYAALDKALPGDVKKPNVDDFAKTASSPANVHGAAADEAMVHGASSKASASNTDERTSILFFSITAISQKDIDYVIKEIEEVGNEAMKDMVLDNEHYQKMIARLTEDQMRRIKMLEKTDLVVILIDKGKRINRIRIRGDADDVAKAFEKITGIFHEAGRLAHQEMEAKLIAKEAQWEYTEGDQTYEAYPANINSIIETAFQEKKQFAKWEEENGTYQVEFVSLLETKENDAESQVKVRRTGNIMIKYPDTWEQMNDGETFKKVRLSPGSKECLKVEARINREAGDTIIEFVSIHRIQNSTLYKQYAAKKQHMEVVYANAPKVEIERRLWHGTKEESLEHIENYGFNRSYSGRNVGALHGKGAYFATEWGYSARDEYSKPNAKGNKFIYQVAVLAGEFTKSHSDLIDAPLKPGSKVVKYDSVVDNVQDPQTCVIFSDHQAYPEYLIEFVPTTKAFG